MASAGPSAECGRIKAVIFDLFGTLIRLTRDTKPHFRLCRATVAQDRLRSSQIVDAPYLVDFCNVLAVSPPPDIDALEQDLADDVDSAEVFDDALLILEQLHSSGIRLGLISNLASPYKRAFFKLGLSRFFEVVVFSCDVGMAKPNPDIYRLALSRLGVDADSTIMVGDKRRADVDGPGACGIRGYLIDRTGRDTGTCRINALTELVSVFDT